MLARVLHMMIVPIDVGVVISGRRAGQVGLMAVIVGLASREETRYGGNVVH